MQCLLPCRLFSGFILPAAFLPTNIIIDQFHMSGYDESYADIMRFEGQGEIEKVVLLFLTRNKR